MTNRSKDVRDILSAATAAFAAELPERIRELEEAAGHSPEAVQSLAHQLAGSAGLYGYRDLGRVARELERVCLDAMARGDDIDLQVMARISDMVSSIKAIAASGRTEATDVVTFGVTRAADTRVRPEGKRDVIVVEDNAGHLATLEELLSGFGYVVRGFADPSALGKALKDWDAAAVIMDIAFPGDRDGGINAVAALNEEGSLTCPVVYLSAREDAQARLGAMRTGCEDYIVKPVDIGDLVDTLDRVIATA